MKKMCEPWEKSLIVKLLGKPFSIAVLYNRLKGKRGPNVGFKLFPLINGYFVATFEKKEDLEFVLAGGPWVISGQYHVIHKWKPGFDASSSKITRTAVWVRILGIQAEFLDVCALKRIGSFLGKALKIDALTLARARGKFARICVELDLTKHLEAYVQLNGAWFNLEYEGLPDICFKCGVYCHRRDSCIVTNEVVGGVSSDVTGMNVDIGGKEIGASDGCTVNSDTNVCNTSVDGSVKESVLGPWMICLKRTVAYYQNFTKKKIKTSPNKPTSKPKQKYF
ncbi:uncharacterized protein LOC126603211 isoform X1 [Malus sylvestris]|uniref:uncharacterized protein LOC126603211 isoform X1 n=1 Tax=Malus sylvestris TaxID=3752 RepID=UPI0021ABB807|nr:uncharacterized protein LOC126603211 isoform X1 [Malus sylvestris]